MKTSSAKRIEELNTENIRDEYLSGMSLRTIGKKYNVDKGTIIRILKRYGNWEELKLKSKESANTVRGNKKLKESVCVQCGKVIHCKRTRKYCSSNCIKKAWRKRNPRTKEQNDVRNNKRRVKNRKQTSKDIWLARYREMLSRYHKRNINKIAEILIKKSINAKTCMVSRSKKHGVKCDITLEDIRYIILNSYGKPCKYIPSRIITYKDMAFDHIIPITKGGPSSKSNVHLITKFSNSVKGSLHEEQLLKLLSLLDKCADAELKKAVLIRLAGGIG